MSDQREFIQIYKMAMTIRIRRSNWDRSLVEFGKINIIEDETLRLRERNGRG